MMTGAGLAGVRPPSTPDTLFTGSGLGGRGWVSARSNRQALHGCGQHGGPRHVRLRMTPAHYPETGARPEYHLPAPQGVRGAGDSPGVGGRLLGSSVPDSLGDRRQLTGSR